MILKRSLPKPVAEISARSGIVVLLLAVSLFFTTGVSMAGEQQKEKAAVAAAQKWLGLVDRGRYAESWARASEYFRNAVTQSRWVETLKGRREILGKLISRKVEITRYATSLPGAPDGQYVVIRFQTSFANKKSAVETVTAMLEKDGKWRIAGYFIR